MFHSVNVGDSTAKAWVWSFPVIVPRVTPPEHTVCPYSQRHYADPVLKVRAVGRTASSSGGHQGSLSDDKGLQESQTESEKV